MRFLALPCVALTAVCVRAAVVHSTAGDLAVRELTSADRVLQANTLYYVRTNMTFAGAASTSPSRPGESGLVVTNRGVTYLYLPEGVTLTVTGGRGADATPGGNGAPPQANYAALAAVDSGLNKPGFEYKNAVGGVAGSAASGGGAGIELTGGTTLRVLGKGKLTARGGDGGKGEAGGAACASTYFFFAHGISGNKKVDTVYSNRTSYNWKETGWWADFVSSNLDGSLYTNRLSECRKQVLKEYANIETDERLTLQPASGAGGGGGGGGGAAAVGSCGSAGGAGTSGGALDTLWITVTNRGLNAVCAKPVQPAGVVASCGTLELDQTVKSDFVGGKGGFGSSTSGSVSRNSYALKNFSDGQPTNVAYATLFLEHGQCGGGGGAGGDGAGYGAGGCGGTGGQGGSSGSAVDSTNALATTWLNSAAVGTNGTAGSVGAASKERELADADRPYCRAIYSAERSAITNTWRFAVGGSVPVPDGADAGFVWWQVGEPASTLPGMTPSGAFRSGDTTRYRPGMTASVADTTYGDVTLGPALLRVNPPNDWPLSVTNAFYENVLAKYGSLKEMQDFMNGTATNGYCRWESYVLGLDYTSTNALLRANVGFETLPGATNVVVQAVGIRPPANTGIDVFYSLWAADDPSGEFRAAKEPQASPVLRQPLEEEKNRQFYFIGVTFQGAEDR